MSSINLQESPLSNCVKYVAIVVDESGSINTTEAQQIRDGLTSFINSQAQSNIILSLIGMSNSDNAVREDHILEKKISGNENDFKNWINSFGTGRVNVQSDYWASGLNAVKNLTIIPDIIFIVSDGMQVNNTSVLKELYQNLNQNSHIFSYNVTGNFLEETLQSEVINPLAFYLGKNPVARTEPQTSLTSDYVNYADFSHLSFEIGNILSDLAKAQIGCTINVEITASNLINSAYTKKKPVSKNAGSLTLKNKGKVPLTLTAGTKIHTENNINGLIFTVENTITIPGLSEAEVSIYVYGAALRDKHSSAVISFSKVNNPAAYSINFNVGRESQIIDIDTEKTNLQSTYLQIAAAGSKGVDSTKGIHLRWMFGGRLGEKHLPKGDLFVGQNSNTSFNKPDDFVKVYRAPYTKTVQTLQLSGQPNVIDNQNAIWIYKTTDLKKSIYINFDSEKYALTKLSIDPLTDSAAFIQAYGNNIIEIECKTDLFFAAELNFSTSNPSRSVRLETLSVTENKITAAKRITNRKTFNGLQSDTVRLVAENGRSIRFKASNCSLNTISFEFYSDFITKANTNGNWILKGKYALSNNDAKVFEQLEPKANSVHGKWLKYNDGQYVNIDNYKNKWNKPTPEGDESEKNIKEIVSQYITLSKTGSNPTAEYDFPVGDPIPVNEPKEGETQEYAQNLTKISYLDVLNIAANDYHVARMLGLGFIDVEEEVLSGEYVYLTEYITFGSLEEGTEATEVQHLSMSIPTSVETERSSLPIQLSKIVPGLNVGADEDQNKITDIDGYSFDGKKRFLSLFMDDIKEYDIVNLRKKIDADFFKSLEEFDASTFTFPVYAGVNYKINDDLNWRKPELSHDLEYRNVDKNLNLLDYEPIPIVIPESDNSFLNIRQEETGMYFYQGYGINIFSRAAAGRQISIKSEIKPANNLIAPANINALLITKENPLLFTSQSEQERLGSITSDDKTLIRILFDYYSAQELISYPLPKEMTVDEAQNNTESIFPDNEEILADHFSFYYKDGLPEVEFGQIESIQEGMNNITSVVRIKQYTTISSGQDVKIKLTEQNKKRFIGGVLTIGDENYIIQEINVVLKTSQGSLVPDEFNYADITVVKKEVTDSLHADGDASVDSEQIKAIKVPENKLCTLVQNMQTDSNWHKPQISFKVQYPDILSTINREVIQPENQNTTDLQLEKTRGIWKNAVIEKQFEDAYARNADGSYKVKDQESQEPIKLDVQKHLGLYKITFPGFNLPQHPQFKNGDENSVEWANGIIRLFTKNCIKAGNVVPVKSRKEFKVVLSQNAGTTGDLILYVNDTDFKLANYTDQEMDPGYDDIITGTQKVNYHPGFKTYLYADQASGITQENIQPRENEDTHYSIFGITTNAKTEIGYKSKISIPSPVYAVKIEEPVKPEAIFSDSLYATRPDFYNRSTFTFTTEYNDNRKPYGLLHYRANEEDILNVLYERPTIDAIREELKKRGGHDEIHFAERWKNFIDFNTLESEGNYKIFSSEEESLQDYRFPLPDNKELIALINDFVKWHNTQVKPEFAEPQINSITVLNKIIISKGVQNPITAVHFIEQAIHAAFVPLTEIPVVYEYIKGADYVPVNKKQTIKDKNGFALKPTDNDFDIAPMMKIINEAENVTQFTDFNLDGNSQSIYFYAVREMDIKMNFGEFSDLLGPVKLVASTPPQTPEIKRLMPILENKVLGIKPSIQIELNAYQPAYKIRKINIYRADTMQKAQSIRTMKLAKEILIDEDTLSSDFKNVWTVYDDFEDLDYVPFGDGLFYRITVSRQIEYADAVSTNSNPIINIDYAPSQPSKITAAVIVDTISPDSPELNASATVTGSNGEYLKPVVFSWDKTVYNGKYHLYKMNNQGNWEKLQEIVSNSANVVLPLLETKLKTDELLIKNDIAERIYHHFKVISENSSGMLSSEEKILTL